MSQWGKKRTFVCGDASISVVPDVCSSPFEKISDVDSIVHLVRVDDAGEREECMKLFEKVVQEWMGRSYGDWVGGK